jgi:subtilisin family serine protease
MEGFFMSHHKPAGQASARSRVFVALGLAGLLAIDACTDRSASERLSAPQALRASDAPDSGEVSTEPRTIPDQYIVVFKPAVDDAPGLAKALVAMHGGRIRYQYSNVLSGFAANLPEAAVEALKHNPNIELVEPDGTVEVQGEQSPVPSWGLDRIDQPGNRLDKKYDYATPAGAGVNAYIIDTGIRTTHVDFGGRAFEAFTLIDDGNGAQDCYGHGTHVAGTLGGKLYGVAKAVRLYSVRVLPCDGHGEMSALIAALDWVAANRVLPAVVNISLTGEYSDAANAAIQAVIASGATVVVAAGNNFADACSYSPASAPNALTVGASNLQDTKAQFSNSGPCVDLFAPGVNISSDYVTSDTAVLINQGTSMSSPHVAGAAALYLSTNPAASPAQVSNALLGMATRGLLTEVQPNTPNLLLYTGAIVGSVTPTPTPTPTPSPTPTTDKPPTASFSVTCSKNVCRFDASASKDDLGIASYGWNFGNGSSAVATTTAITTFAYTNQGNYTVVLTVTDTKGQTAKTSQIARPKKP